jgi:hypothetical protein
MEICISCRSRTSTDRCPNRAIKGLTFCGIHVRAKEKRSWYSINKLDSKASQIQKVWRGYHIRFLLNKLGKGAIKRSLIHNTDEPVTLEPIASIHPFHFFSFEENGKTWGFDIQSISRICLQHIVPTNPCTRQPLTYETRRRVRWYLQYLSRHKDTLLNEFTNKREQYIYRVNQVTQILHENGFTDFRPEYLTTLSPTHIHVVRYMMAYDIHTLNNQRKHRYISLLKSQIILNNYVFFSALMNIFSHIWASAEEYEFCFILMSALFRL